MIIRKREWLNSGDTPEPWGWTGWRCSRCRQFTEARTVTDRDGFSDTQFRCKPCRIYADDRPKQPWER